MVRILRFAVVALLVSVGVGMAQTKPNIDLNAAAGWKGKLRMGGIVVDEAGKVIPGVTVKFVFLPTNDGPADVVTNAKGEWTLQNIAEGTWSLEFWKEGLDPRQAPLQVGGKVKEPIVTLRMTKEGTDPKFAMRTGAAKAQVLFDQKKYAESRAVYEGLLAKYPTMHQLHNAIARDYLMEKNYTAAIEHLQAYVTAVPSDNLTKVGLATVLFEADRRDEAWALFSTFDTTMLRDALDLESPGFTLLRAKKPAEALKYFERVVLLYPDDPQGYYYRGLTNWQIGATVEKAGSPESKAKLEAARADLTKFIGLVPNAEKDQQDPNYGNVDNAKKMLEQIK